MSSELTTFLKLRWALGACPNLFLDMGLSIIAGIVSKRSSYHAILS